MSSKTVIAKYHVSGETFEVFVDSELAFEYMTGKRTDPISVLTTEEVFKDANKGERQSEDKIKKIFGTTELPKVIEKILKNGNVPITTEQKNKMLEEKRKQIITIIARNSIDPRTSAPHPSQRIENAMEAAKVTIDPFKGANEQVDIVLKKINMIIPIKFAMAKMEVIIPADSANRCYGTLKQYGLKEETWLPNGSLSATVEFPAGLQAEFMDKINSLTHGSASTKLLGV